MNKFTRNIQLILKLLIVNFLIFMVQFPYETSDGIKCKVLDGGCRGREFNCLDKPEESLGKTVKWFTSILPHTKIDAFINIVCLQRICHEVVDNARHYVFCCLLCGYIKTTSYAKKYFKTCNITTSMLLLEQYKFETGINNESSMKCQKILMSTLNTLYLDLTST